MSFDDIRWARDIAGLEDPVLRHLLLLIATYVGGGPSTVRRSGRKHERPICYASRQTLARQMRVSTRSLDRYIAALKNAGLICSKQIGGGHPAEITLLRHLGGEADEVLVRHPQGEANFAPVRHLGGEADVDLASPLEGGLVRHTAGEHKALKAHSTPAERPVNAASDDGVECKPANIAAGISREHDDNDANTASLGSPSRSVGGSPAPPSETTRRLNRSEFHLETTAPVPFKRTPNNVPPIRDRALYNRLTSRSASRASSPQPTSGPDPHQPHDQGDR